MRFADLARKRSLARAVLLLVFIAPLAPCQAQQPVPDLAEASLEQLGNIKVLT